MMRRCLISVALVLSSIAIGDETPRRTATRPATMPATRPVEELVAQLGHKDFRRREEAGRELERMGEAALSALTQAKGGEPEVSVRAEQVIRRIQERGGREAAADARGRRPIDARFPQRGRPRTISARNSAAAETEIVVQDGEHKTSMRCTRNGYFVRNSRVINGDEKVEVWRAKDRAELKRLHPLVYDFYVETIRDMTGGDDATEETIRRQMVWFEQFLTPPGAEDLR